MAGLTVRLGVALATVLMMATSLAAEPKVRVMALFPDKAMVNIDGKNRLLKAGETSPEGVELVAANPREARIRIQGGPERVAKLNAGVQASYAKRESYEVRIPRVDRHFFIDGAINGRPVKFLVDTGATTVAMDVIQAKRLGIPYYLEGRKGYSHTASGPAVTYRILLDRVQVGEIVQRNVPGAVIDAETGGPILLGMSFLSQLEMNTQPNLMILRTK